MQAFDLSQKVSVITGAGSGIGKSIAEVFSRHGSKVYILDVEESVAQKVEQQINAEGGKAVYKLCNVARQQEVKEVLQQIIDESNKIDILVNNAGVAHIGNVEATAEEDIDRIYSINVKGVYNCLHSCIPYMKAQGGGVVLNMASVASVLGIADRFAYSMSKGAVLSMTLSIAKDYIADNIRCNSIAPGRVHTPFVDGFLKKNYPGRESEMFEKLSKTQPIGRMGKPEEIAYLALFLCSDEAGFITGCNYPIDGGFITLNS
ncbi:SDR family NAD(P)-dependent oxidoreductase [Catalinimonas niigatensis]|uniref:SDR family NAD(P)-dependent oxidoreductase n=1 Tax=Catalinimonas niigatensis TaxID=1397264 RepID=UPI00266607CA|nr:glucose 1-dehydrogenase [Catalinimonas niigatensis]WPP50170.1 glucose 1-dehydrogenase [Catalinimonas niigatensis]